MQCLKVNASKKNDLFSTIERNTLSDAILAILAQNMRSLLK